MQDERLDQREGSPLDIFRELAQMVNALPLEERRRYHREFGKLVHDLRHSLSLVANAEALLHADIDPLADNVEMVGFLEILRKANTRAIGTLDSLCEAFADQIRLDGLS